MESFAKLLRAFQKETALLRRLFQRQAPYSSHIGLWRNPDPTAVQSYSVVRLHDAWARFCRELVLLSAAGDTTTAASVYVPRSPLVGPYQNPLDVLKSTYSRRRQRFVLWEPKWYDPADAVQAAQALRIANFPTVSAGLGLAGHGVDELRACRNYLAHRNRLAHRELDPLRHRLGVSLSTPAEELVNETVLGGVSVFEEWCIELTQRASLASQ